MSLVEKLINLVGQNRCLYDRNHQKYKDKHVRDRLWTEISSKLGIEEVKCKAKWRGIKARYLREVRSKQAPSGDFPSIKKEWKYFHMLSFLNGINHPQKIPCNFDNNTDLVTSLGHAFEESPLEDIYIEEDFPNTSASSNGEERAIQETKSFSSTTNSNIVHDELVHVNDINQPPPEKPKTHFKHGEPFYKTLIEEIKHAENSKDEVELYFKSLCKIVSFVKLTPLEFLEFQSNISLKVKEVLEKIIK